jgi:hypothetical protein
MSNGRRSDQGGEPVTVTAYPDGPLIVRGDVRVVDEDGEPVPRDRATMALCRCGMSSRAPLCDGTHKVTARRRPRAE